MFRHRPHSPTGRSWREPFNTGAVSAGNTPVEFSETKNVKWKTEIPGKGHCTPMILGNQIIIQTAIATDKKPQKADTSKTAVSLMAPSQPSLFTSLR